MALRPAVNTDLWRFNLKRNLILHPGPWAVELQDINLLKELVP